MKNTPIPNNLRKYRELHFLRQKDVAQKLGFSSIDRISKWENGLTFPHPINLFKLSLIYQVPPHELYAGLVERLKSENMN